MEYFCNSVISPSFYSDHIEFQLYKGQLHRITESKIQITNLYFCNSGHFRLEKLQNRNFCNLICNSFCNFLYSFYFFLFQ